MPYDKGDFTQQGINGDVSALVRLNDKRVVKMVLSSDDESSNVDVTGTVYDYLNGETYPLGGTTPTGTITITENTEPGSPLDIAQYRYADVSVSGGGGGGVTTYAYTVNISNTASINIMVDSAGCSMMENEGVTASGIVFASSNTLSNNSSPVTITGECPAADMVVPVIAFLTRVDRHDYEDITVTSSNEVNASVMYNDDGLMMVMITGDNASIDISLDIE